MGIKEHFKHFNQSSQKKEIERDDYLPVDKNPEKKKNWSSSL
jgi:hypothetical protein